MEWPKIAELVKQLKNGERGVVELAQDCLKTIEKSKSLNAVLEINPQALERAKTIAKFGQKGKLFGVPFLAKDNFLTSVGHTTAASNILKPFQAPYQATAIERLEAEGAILLGKTNLDAFAHGSSTENSDFGPTKNPHDPTRVPGGSSGGSAAAVAKGLAAFALGTDTGGSIRLPASFCGVVGLKPSYGLISRYGVVAMASSTDVIGPITRSVEDAGYVLEVLAGKDPLDATTIERDKQAYSQLMPRLKGVKIGIIKQHMAAGVEKPVREQIKSVVGLAQAAGAKTLEVDIAVDELALAAYYIIVPAEISSNLARYDGIKYGFRAPKAKSLDEVYEQTRHLGFNVENQRRILIGTYVLSSGYYEAFYKKAQTLRTLLCKEYEKVFRKFDVLIGPTAATPAFKLGAKQDPLSMYLTDVMTVTVNLVGMPAITIPAGKAQGLPVSIQIMATPRQERKLLSVAKAIEDLIGAKDD
ncbi:Asp-tRNA(Asn)/Glu-tRNA(Gln) amidotransferase subunit GatA [Candidatus Microgenomates bacterium]|nr:Asp-tRNA(Asn)/Glu-tRNA(Gln) amidotransferase subunit GatA [Candidatus Microgenomates bacterium]